jgi:hypothetical protein
MDEKRPVTYPGRWSRWPAYTVAGAAVAIALLRVMSAIAFQRFDTTALVLFAIASVAVLVPEALPRLRKVKYGATELEFAELERLPTVPAGDTPTRALPRGVTAETAADWTAERERLKETSRDVFLAHVIRPSKKRGQTYDIFILLTRTQPVGLGDVTVAEFFFGKHWGNRVFRVERTGDTIGISTAAYGPFLAICRVTFEDGHTALLDRFIDFEMGKVFEELNAAAAAS